MKIAMFGVTGNVGSVLLEQALDAGHDVEVLVRSPGKLATRSPHLSITEGDACDAAAVESVVAGTDAVLSTLGGFRGPESLSVGTAAIMGAMARHSVRRIVIMQGFHLHIEGDPRNVGKRLIGPIMKTVAPAIVRHAAIMGKAVGESDLDWTIVRAPRVIAGGPTGHMRTGMLKIGPWSTVTCGDVASLMLECLTSDRFVGDAPMIAS
ncbi:NAD(P)H-binding protein [Antrihabitans sp. YC3-6]|uniref:NAD(P)H-binding protein n=1 Tax=Antrihabitans stalagmiti TaxID=2799499 RepID=A0A934NWK9_9NOCA|nr:NAD(P)H-binding protein [Antrihabitans stalagmiti]MBJ8342589.1 NAD(P)H-binding protein [Antrihabitans stalagmiti]